MKKIPLSQGKYALVDDADFEELNKYNWFAHKKSRGIFYVERNYRRIEGKQTTIKMHREIMQPLEGMVIDHIDGDGLNNQRSNLRICTGTENKQNQRKYKNNTSGFKGVSFYRGSRKWGANIGAGGERVFLGLLTSKLKAYEAYCEACIKYHGAFSRLK